MENTIQLTCSDKIKPKFNCTQPDVIVPADWLNLEMKCSNCGSPLVSPELYNHDQNIKNLLTQ